MSIFPKLYSDVPSDFWSTIIIILAIGFIMFLLYVGIFIGNKEVVVSSPSIVKEENIIFSEKEIMEFIKPNTTNNYLFEKKEIDGKTYYIKIN